MLVSSAKKKPTSFEFVFPFFFFKNGISCKTCIWCVFWCCGNDWATIHHSLTVGVDGGLEPVKVSSFLSGARGGQVILLFEARFSLWGPSAHPNLSCVYILERRFGVYDLINWISRSVLSAVVCRHTWRESRLFVRSFVVNADELGGVATVLIRSVMEK